MDDDRRTSAEQEQPSSTSSTATNNRDAEEGQEPDTFSVVDADDLLAGYVDVVDSSQRRSSPFASPTLRVVPEEQGNTAEAAAVRVVSPPPTPVPQAHAEDGPHPSPRRRGTPTAATAQRRRNRQHQVTYEDLVSRPRSNPRSRTPMRYESPLDHGAFHGDRANNNNNDNNNPPRQNHEARTISIRPSAGLGVGVVRAMPERVSESSIDCILRFLS